MAKQDTSETINVDNLVTVVMCTLLSISDSLQPILHLTPTVWEHTDGPGPTRAAHILFIIPAHKLIFGL